MDGIEAGFSTAPLRFSAKSAGGGGCHSVPQAVTGSDFIGCSCAINDYISPFPPADRNPKTSPSFAEERERSIPPERCGRGVTANDSDCRPHRAAGRLFKPLLSPELLWLATQCRPFLRLQLLSVISVTAGILMALAEPAIIKWLIDCALATARLSLLARATAVFAGLYCGYAILLYLGSLATSVVTEKLTFRIRMWLVHRLQSHSVECRENSPWDDLLHRLGWDVEEIGLFGSQALPTIARVGVTMTVSLTAMFLLSWKLALVILPLLLISIVVQKFSRRRLTFAVKRARRHSGNFSLLLQEQLIGFLQLQLLNRTGTHGRKLARAAAKSATSMVTRRKEEARWSAVWMMLGLTGGVVALGFGGYQVTVGAMSLGGLIAYCLYVSLLIQPLIEAVQIAPTIRRAEASIRRLQEISSQCYFPPPKPPCPQSYEREGISLAFRNVSFSYSPSRPVLKSASFEAYPGQTIAIVGPRECGKTAIAYLITRLYDPAEGTIFLNGRDSRTMGRHEVRALVSIIPQYPAVFSGSLRDNLRYGQPHATDDEMERVIHATQLRPLLRSLPNGLDEPLGLLGMTLSESERKRVALARALLRRPQILILDELTGLLDGQQVTPQLLATFDSLPPHRVIIAISHRPSSVIWADKILLLSKNQIVAQGSHDDLLRTSDAYRTLYWDTLVEDSDESVQSGSGSKNAPDGEIAPDE